MMLLSLTSRWAMWWSWQKETARTTWEEGRWVGGWVGGSESIDRLIEETKAV